MNYAGKFGASGLDSLSNAHVDVDSPSVRGHSADAITVPDAHLLFSGDFHKSGSDLVISDDLHRVVVPNYFHGDKRPALVSPEGAPLDPKVIEALTGHTAYAQAGGAVAGKVVGHVASMTGSASIVRNGVTIVLNNGDAVYQSDVVQTGSGSTLGLVLIDGTTFNLTANARLMLNDLTYDATSTSNTSLFTLVQGAANFVAGQVAKTGDMKVGTPVATMGIRGTAVILDISSVDGKVSISVVDQQDGLVHAVQVLNARGDLIGMVTSNGSTLTLTPTATFEVIAQESNKTVAQIADEFNTFRQLLNTYDGFKAIAPDTPPPSDGKRGDANPQTTKFATNTITPSNTPSLNPETAPGAKTGSNNTTSPDPTSNQSNNSGTAPTTTVKADIITTDDNGVPQKHEVVIAKSTAPFPVTPSTVNKVSSGPGDHFGPVMSADGKFITYDPDGAIYLFDRKAGTTITIQAPADGFTFGSPTISADGHFIVYQRSDGVVFLYNNNAADAANYHHITQLVAGKSPAISGDGSVIVVEQGGTSLGGYDQQGHLLFTITPASAGATGAVWKPAISADGHLVAFWNSDAASAGGTGHLFTFDRSTGVTTQIAATPSGAGNNAASISADGRYVTYQSDSSGHAEIYLYDLNTGHVIFHTANASGGSYNPVISPDGHFIIFASDAKLTGNDTNTVADTYVVDVTDPNHPSFKLVSVGAGDAPGNAASNLGGAISSGGKFIAFGSSASNFANGDDNGTGDIFVFDPSSGRDVIIQEDANSPSVLTAGGSIAVEGVAAGATITVSDTSNFSAVLSADGKSIVWNFHEAKSDFASLQYGQDASRAVSITLISDGFTLAIPVTVTVHNAVQNAAPVLNSATLTVSEGDTVVFGPANIGISDANDSSFTFKVTGVSHGQFQVFDDGQWKNTFTFTSAELAGGLVRFIHDGSEFAPTFAIQADDGEAANHRSNILTGSVNFTNVNDAPHVTGATLVVARGGTLVLGAANLNITHTDSSADFSSYPTRADLSAFSNDSFSGSTLLISGTFTPGSLISVNDPDSSGFAFQVSNVTHGVFQTYDGETWSNATTFTSADLNAGHVRFVREDSENTPTFSIQSDDGAGANHAGNVFAGTVSDPPIVVTTNTAPVITAASLTVSEGGTVLITTANGTVVDPDSTSFTFTITNGTHGTIQVLNDGHWVAATQFTTADLVANHVRFVHDGGEAAPTFSIQADDGAATNHLSNVFAGTVTFTNVNDAPTATPVVLTAGTEDTAYTITSAALLAGVTDPDGPFPLSITDVGLVSGGGTLHDNDDGTWTYTPAHNYNGPVSFNYTASDGSLTSHSTASLSLAAVNDEPTVSGAVTGDATENDTSVFLKGTANASDPDGDILQVVGLPETLPAGVTYSSLLQGFLLDPGNVAYERLAAGETSTVTVNYSISDGHVAVPGSVSWTIHGVNDAPGLDSVGLDAIAEDTPSVDIAGATVSVLFAHEFSDIDHGSSFAGVAVTGNLATPDQGVWQYKTPTSGIWENIGSVDPAHALAFDADTLLRFVPAHNFSGSVGSLEVHAIDNTYDEEFTTGFDIGGGRYTINLTDTGDEPLGHGGSTPFSDQPSFLGTAVTPVNDPPHANDDTLALSAPQGDSWVLNPDNGHYYRLVETHQNWADARAQALSDGGYLATITSSAENDFVRDFVIREHNALIGGSDVTVEGEWRWMDGPEAGQQFWSVPGGASASNHGYSVGVYANWDARGEPNNNFDGGPGAEQYLNINGENAAWNDIPGYSQLPSVEEWGGRPGDANVSEDSTLHISASTLLANDTDPDASDPPHIASVDGTSAHGASITFSGSEIAYDPTHAAEIQALAAGETATDTFTYTIADGHGDTSAATVTLLVAGVNDAPLFDGEKPAPAYTAGDDPIAIVHNVSASDIDSANYAGGSLTATVTHGGHEGDTLSIAGNEHIFVQTGAVVMFDADGDGGDDAVAIGTMTNYDYNSLTVTLNGNADDAAVAALTEAIAFSNALPNPVADTRTVTFTLRDGGGTAFGAFDSAFFQATVDVPPSNHAATITGDATGQLVEDDTPSGGAVPLDTVSGVLTVNDVDADETYFAPVLPAALTGAYGQFTFDSSNGHWSYQLDNATVQHLGANDHVTETLTVESIDGTAQQEIVVTIDGKNDAPVFGGEDLESTFNPGGGPVALLHKAVVSDVDSANYNGGRLSAEVTGGGHDGDALSVVGNPHISLQGGASGTTVMYDPDGYGDDFAVAIGTLHTSGSGLTVDLNGHATDTAVAALTEAIEFSNSLESPAGGTRTVTFTLRDGGGTAHDAHDSADTEATVVVTAPAVLANADAVSTAEDQPLTVLLAEGVLANDTPGGVLAAELVTGPENGTLDFNADGTYTYTPDADFNGQDSFTYTASLSTANLIVNPGAESGPSAANFSDVVNPQGWTAITGNMTETQYATGGTDYSLLNAGDSLHVNGGANFFSGGPNNAVSQIHQVLDVSAYASAIDSGAIEVHLAGDFGGYDGQDDNFTLTIRYLASANDATGLGSETIGGLTSDDRDGVTELLHRAMDDTAPAGTRFIDVILSSNRTAGSYNDGYADNLSLTLTDHTHVSAPATVTIDVTPVNDAPVLADNDTLQLNPIDYSEVENAGQTVASLLGSDVSDPDGPSSGIAIIGNDADHGRWQYKPASGGGWNDFVANGTNALLLGSTDHVRFLPDNSHAGPQFLSFRAWDGSAGTVGEFMDIESSGTGGSTPFSIHANTAELVVTVPVPDQAPTVGGDMAILTVKGGHEVMLTIADLNAIDPDTAADELTFRVDGINHGLLTFGDDRTTLEVDDTFTLADIQAQLVFYQSVDDYVGADHIRLTLSDGVSGTPTSAVVLSATIVDAQFAVKTADGYNFEQDNAIGAMGSSAAVLSPVMPDTFTIRNGDANRDFIFIGTDFAYDSDRHVFTSGIITSIREVTHDASHTPIATFDMSVSVIDWYAAAVAVSNGDQSLIEALTRSWTFNFIGNSGADAFNAGDVNDIFTGRGGSDAIDGQFGYDRANYGGATGPIQVLLAAGLVAGTGVDASGVGVDTLKSIELVTGGNYNDTFDATGFSATSQNAGSTVTNNVGGLFNEFEGRGGTDTIIGNSQTRISYYHGTAGVTVTFDSHSWDGFVTPGAPGNVNPVGGASGTATGDASVGTDHFTGVNQVRGTFFDDHFTGSNNPSGTTESFEGLGGDDFIDGGGGFDRAAYFAAADDTGIAVNLGDGTVIGGIDTGSDTLRSIEAIWGTNFADNYNASTFSGSSTNAGNAGNNGAASSFNEFEGGAGDDRVTGNNNTRVYFGHSTAGVVVKLDPGTNGAGTTGAGFAVGNDSVGHDTFLSGVTRVRGSEFNDIISGNGAANILEGQGGNDIIDGKAGNDSLTGGTGSDIFVYGAGGGADRITDFNRGDGDRIDLRAMPGIYGLADIQAIAATSGSDTVLTFSRGNAITLANVSLSSLAATDFIFAGQPGFVSEMSSEGNLGIRSEHVVVDGTHAAAIKPVAFNMQLNTAAPGVLTIVANDVENPLQSGSGPSGELDNVYVNGHLLGQLTQGVDGVDTSSSFSVDPSFLVSGDNLVEVHNVNSTTGWNFTVVSANYLSASNGFTSLIVPDDVQRQSGNTTTGDIGVRSAWSAAHPDTFTLGLAASGTFSNVALTIHANDVELPGTAGGANGEIDQVFVNGHSVGFLTQALDAQNSTTVLSVDSSFLLHGNNVVTVYNVNTDSPGTWNFQVDSLSFTGGISTASAATSPSVAVAVQTPDGYDFSTFYGDLAAGFVDSQQNTIDHFFVYNPVKHITFEMVGTGFTYNADTHRPTGGTITEIDILDSLTMTTQDHVLVNSNGWNINAGAFINGINQFASIDPSTHATGLAALDGIFGAATYNYVGSGGSADFDSDPHDGADVFVGGGHADTFNGRPGPFGPMDPGSDTVDYSHAPGIGAGPAGITVDLLHPENNTGAAKGDIFVSIENLRGSNFDDTLRGDGNNNVIEGGLGNDVLDGGGNGIGNDTVSYQHATDYVTVDLRISGQQDTHSAGLDTLSNFEAVRGSAYSDTLIGNGSSILEGGGGNDRLIGQSDGHDTANYEHATAGVTVDLNYQGGDPQNTRGAGLDTLTNIANVSGSQFNDTLIGDSNNNVFFGNGGHDTFVFSSTTGHDTIGDFTTGGDKIDLGYTVPSDPNDSTTFDRWLSSIASTDGSDTLIDLDPHPDVSHPGPNTVLLKNVYMGNLQASDFVAHAGFGF